MWKKKCIKEGVMQVDVIDGFFNGVVFILLIFLLSRVAHHFHNTKVKLEEIDRKLNVLMDSLDIKE